MQTKKTILACFVFAAICFALFSLSGINVKADDVQGNVTVNSVPSVGTVTLWNQNGTVDPIDLSVGSTVTVTANATITDLNNGTDIANATAVLYSSSVGAGDPNNNNTHITNSLCDLSEVDPEVDNNTIVATCTFEMNYNALPGTWNVTITATDAGALSSSNTGGNEVNDNIGLEVNETSISFGSMTSGSNSSDDEVPSTTITNMGNVDINPKVSGTDFTCTNGEIPVTNIKYNNETGNYDSMSSSLSEVATPDDNSLIHYLSDEETPQGSEYWTIQVPSDVGGVCTNTITIVAEAAV